MLVRRRASTQWSTSAARHFSNCIPSLQPCMASSGIFFPNEWEKEEGVALEMKDRAELSSPSCDASHEWRGRRESKSFNSAKPFFRRTAITKGPSYTCGSYEHFISPKHEGFVISSNSRESSGWAKGTSHIHPGTSQTPLGNFSSSDPHHHTLARGSKSHPPVVTRWSSIRLEEGDGGAETLPQKPLFSKKAEREAGGGVGGGSCDGF